MTPLSTTGRTICFDDLAEMKQETGTELNSVQRFRVITERMAQVFESKNHDYGNSFSDCVGELGIVAGFATIYNKCNRLKTLIKCADVKVSEETLADTLLDMANYCVMLKMELDKLSERNYNEIARR